MPISAAWASHPDTTPGGMLRLASDEQLVGAMRAGSDAAFEVLFGRHHARVLAYCRKVLASQADAEDAAQLTFVFAYDYLRNGEQPPARLLPWLYRVAGHRCRAVISSRRDWPVADVPESATHDLIADVMTREAVRDVLADVAHLPPAQRAAIVLAVLHDRQHVDIAEALGCGPEKIKALVFQARSSLAADRAARDIPCAVIREQLRTLRGPALRRASLRRHLRTCAGCRAYREELRRERGRQRVLVPWLPGLGFTRAGVASLLGSGGGVGVTVSGVVAATLAAVAIPAGGVTAAAVIRAGHADGTPRAAQPAAVPIVRASSAQAFTQIAMGWPTDAAQPAPGLRRPAAPGRDGEHATPDVVPAGPAGADLVLATTHTGDEVSTAPTEHGAIPPHGADAHATSAPRPVFPSRADQPRTPPGAEPAAAPTSGGYAGGRGAGQAAKPDADKPTDNKPAASKPPQAERPPHDPPRGAENRPSADKHPGAENRPSADNHPGGGPPGGGPNGTPGGGPNGTPGGGPNGTPGGGRGPADGGGEGRGATPGTPAAPGKSGGPEPAGPPEPHLADPGPNGGGPPADAPQRGNAQADPKPGPAGPATSPATPQPRRGNPCPGRPVDNGCR